MKSDVVSIPVSATVAEAAALLAARRIGLLPVTNDEGKLVGVLPMRSLLALVMPDFVRLVEELNFIHDFGAVEAHEPSPEAMAQPVSDVMEPPDAIEESCGLLRALALMHHHDVTDLPVVGSDGRLVGIASRVDLGTAILARWHSPSQGGAV
jgi:CBS domain-containing protein